MQESSCKNTPRAPSAPRWCAYFDILHDFKTCNLKTKLVKNQKPMRSRQAVHHPTDEDVKKPSNRAKCEETEKETIIDEPTASPLIAHALTMVQCCPSNR